MTLTMTSRAVAWRLVWVGCLAGAAMLPLTLPSEAKDGPVVAKTDDAKQSTGDVRAAREERRRKLWENVEVSRDRLRKKALEAWKNEGSNSAAARRPLPIKTSVPRVRVGRTEPVANDSTSIKRNPGAKTSPKPSILRQPTRIFRDYGGSVQGVSPGQDERARGSGPRPDVTLELRRQSPATANANATTIRPVGPNTKQPKSGQPTKAQQRGAAAISPQPNKPLPKASGPIQPKTTQLKPLDTTQRSINRVPLVHRQQPKTESPSPRVAKVPQPRPEIHRPIVSRPSVPQPRPVTAIPLSPRGTLDPTPKPTVARGPVVSPNNPTVQLVITDDRDETRPAQEVPLPVENVVAVAPGSATSRGSIGGLTVPNPIATLPLESGHNELVLADSVQPTPTRVVFTVTDDGIESVEIPLKTKTGLAKPSVVSSRPAPAAVRPTAPVVSVDPSAPRPRPAIESVKPVAPVRLAQRHSTAVRAAKPVDLRPKKPMPEEVVAQPKLARPPTKIAIGPQVAKTPTKPVPDRLAIVRATGQVEQPKQDSPKNPRTPALAKNELNSLPRHTTVEPAKLAANDQTTIIRPLAKVERRPGLIAQNSDSPTSSRRQRPYDRNRHTKPSVDKTGSKGYLLALNEPNNLMQPRSVQALSTNRPRTPQPRPAATSVVRPVPSVARPLPTVNPLTTRPVPVLPKPVPSVGPKPSVAKSVPSIKPLPSIVHPKTVPPLVPEIIATGTGQSPSDLQTGSDDPRGAARDTQLASSPEVKKPATTELNPLPRKSDTQGSVITLNAGPTIPKTVPTVRVLREPAVTHHRIQLEVNQSGLLRLPKDVEKVTVVKQELCDAILFENRQVSIIAKVAGTTHVMLSMKGESATTNYLISITPQKVASQQADSYSKLEQSIHKMFPSADVSISEERGRITVTGEVDSNDQAFKILALVRQVRLVPVVDRLIVRRSD